jgi:hypothetical protein
MAKTLTGVKAEGVLLPIPVKQNNGSKNIQLDGMCVGVLVIVYCLLLSKTHTDGGVFCDVKRASWCQKSNNALFRDSKI